MNVVAPQVMWIRMQACGCSFCGSLYRAIFLPNSWIHESVDGDRDASVDCELGSFCVVASNSCNSTTDLVLAVCVGVVVLIWLIGCCSVGQLTSWSVGWLVGEVPEGA